MTIDRFFFSPSKTFFLRSSNRDPGARAADSLSLKDHGGDFTLSILTLPCSDL